MIRLNLMRIWAGAAALSLTTAPGLPSPAFAAGSQQPGSGRPGSSTPGVVTIDVSALGTVITAQDYLMPDGNSPDAGQTTAAPPNFTQDNLPAGHGPDAVLQTVVAQTDRVSAVAETHDAGMPALEPVQVVTPPRQAAGPAPAPAAGPGANTPAEATDGANPTTHQAHEVVTGIASSPRVAAATKGGAEKPVEQNLGANAALFGEGGGGPATPPGAPTRAIRDLPRPLVLTHGDVAELMAGSETDPDTNKDGFKGRELFVPDASGRRGVQLAYDYARKTPSGTALPIYSRWDEWASLPTRNQKPYYNALRYSVEVGGRSPYGAEPHASVQTMMISTQRGVAWRQMRISADALVLERLIRALETQLGTPQLLRDRVLALAQLEAAKTRQPTANEIKRGTDGIASGTVTPNATHPGFDIRVVDFWGEPYVRITQGPISRGEFVLIHAAQFEEALEFLRELREHLRPS